MNIVRKFNHAKIIAALHEHAKTIPSQNKAEKAFNKRQIKELQRHIKNNTCPITATILMYQAWLAEKEIHDEIKTTKFYERKATDLAESLKLEIISAQFLIGLNQKTLTESIEKPYVSLTEVRKLKGMNCRLNGIIKSMRWFINNHRNPDKIAPIAEVIQYLELIKKEVQDIGFTCLTSSAEIIIAVAKVCSEYPKKEAAL